LRKLLIEDLIKEVLGPRNGKNESLSERNNPYKEYITGVIVPYDYVKEETDPDSEVLDIEGDGMSEDDDSENQSLFSTPMEINAKSRPKSFGVSFFIKGEEITLEVCVSWGRYHFSEGSCNWLREGYCKEVKIDNNDINGEIIVYENVDGKVILFPRKIKRKEGNTIIISLINKINYDKSEWATLAEKCLFQPSIRINIKKGNIGAFEQQKDDTLRFLYRNNPVIAKGHMCSAIWKDIDYTDYINGNLLWPDRKAEMAERFMRPDIRTEFVPMHPISSPIFDWDTDYGDCPEISSIKISEMWDEQDIISNFTPFIEGYTKWIDHNKSKLSEVQEKDKETAIKLIENQIVTLERLKMGVDLLLKDKKARLAFCFANRVVWLQNNWKRKEDFIWRPFQLVFFLLSLESIHNEKSRYREMADLLWVPTGGGKTEAYLGIMAFTMALRRIRARLGDINNGGGVSILSRYTLRLLTIQQFRRTLRMVTAAEYLRVIDFEGIKGWRPEKCDLKENMIYGSLRFSTGIWVGGNVTPNHLRQGLSTEGGAVHILMGKKNEGEPAQIIRCPVCNSWLAVPQAGLPPKEKIYLVCNADEKPEDIRIKIETNDEIMNAIQNFDLITVGHKQNYMTLAFEFKNENNMTPENIENFWRLLIEKVGHLNRIFSPTRPGYFECEKEDGRRKELPLDFEIYCPNPCCDLNQNVQYFEGVPLCPEGENRTILEDGLVLMESLAPFKENSRIPITAYTVDEQVYYRCPTIIVSTVDKIARMAFEPRVGSIFGNVNTYNAYYGYYRNGLMPKNYLKSALKEEYNCRVSRFNPPDLIVQDELHLIEGPLGSMFGLYESIVESVIQSGGGQTKYIASTATIKNADSQVNNIFAKQVFQFPAHGLDMGSNFFVRRREWNDSWNENTPGRIYMGVYSPGNGPLTPSIRIWSSIFRTCHENSNNEMIKYFWSLVGYYNSIRELGGGRALYKEDIVERLSHITRERNIILDPENVIELSSRRDSTDLPQILQELENAIDRNLANTPQAIFTTSMFGTGVDIPHLSLMVVNGQPKTTSQYIQATGRMGRKKGGLIVSFLRAGRPRDLSHYELFPSYHLRQYLEVEPVSVSPFSEGTLERASGPTLVSYLRNFCNNTVPWHGEDGMAILDKRSSIDINTFIQNKLISRLKRIDIPDEQVYQILNYFISQGDRWHEIASHIPIKYREGRLDTDELNFVEYNIYNTPQYNVVLGDPAHEHEKNLITVFKNAPQSLREIEETIGFEV